MTTVREEGTANAKAQISEQTLAYILIRRNEEEDLSQLMKPLHTNFEN